MENDSRNPYAAPSTPESIETPGRQVPTSWRTGLVLAGGVSAIAILLSAMLTIDFTEGADYTRSPSVILFMLLGYSSILVPVGLAISRKRFNQLAEQLQWFVSIALPLGYACAMTILFRNLPNPF